MMHIMPKLSKVKYENPHWHGFPNSNQMFLIYSLNLSSSRCQEKHDACKIKKVFQNYIKL